jgi:hypothetical protein
MIKLNHLNILLIIFLSLTSFTHIKACGFFEPPSEDSSYDGYQTCEEESSEIEEINTDNFPEKSIFETLHSIVAWIIGDEEEKSDENNEINPINEFYKLNRQYLEGELEDLVINYPNIITFANNVKNNFISDVTIVTNIGKKGMNAFACFSYGTLNTSISWLTAAYKIKEYIRVNKVIIDSLTQQIVPNNQLISNVQPALHKLNQAIDLFANCAFISLLCMKNSSAWWLKQPTHWQEPEVSDINTIANAAIWYITSKNTRFMLRFIQNLKNTLTNENLIEYNESPVLLEYIRRTHNDLGQSLDIQTLETQNPIIEIVRKLENSHKDFQSYLDKSIKSLNTIVIIADIKLHLEFLGAPPETHETVGNHINAFIDTVEASKEPGNNIPREPYILPTLQQLIYSYIASFTIVKKITQFFKTKLQQTKTFAERFKENQRYSSRKKPYFDYPLYS